MPTLKSRGPTWNGWMSQNSLDKGLTIIHDKLDYSKTTSPHFFHKIKALDLFTMLPVSAIGMIACGHGFFRYAHYMLDVYKTNLNHTVKSIA